jgi:hypothetical protein
MNSKLMMVIALLALVSLMIIMPVSAAVGDNQTFVATYAPMNTASGVSYSGYTQTGLPTLNDTLVLATWNGDQINPATLTAIDLSQVAILSPVAKSYWNSYSFTAKIYSGSGNTNYGTAMVSFSFNSNSSPTSGIYEIRIDNIAWNSNVASLTFPSGNPTATQLKLNWTSDRGMDGWQENGQGGTPSFGTGSFIYPYWAGGTYPNALSSQSGISTALTNTKTFNFINTVTVTQNAYGYTYSITKGDGTLGNSGNSYVTVTDSASTIYSRLLSKTTPITGTSYSPPIIVSIGDPQTGIVWNNTFFHSSYTLNVIPNNIPVGGSVSAILTTAQSFAELNAYTVNCNGVSQSTIAKVKVNGTSPTWILTGGLWKQVNDLTGTYDVSWGSVFPSQVTLSGWNSPGQYLCEFLLLEKDNYEQPRMYATINVSGGNSYDTVTLDAIDSQTQGYVYGSTISVKNSDGTWKNQTLTNTPVTVQVPDGAFIGYMASATGYDAQSLLYTQITASKSIDITMTNILAAPAGNATLAVYVRTSSNSQWLNLAGASVVLSDGQTKITPESGFASFVLLANSTGTCTVSENGYQTLTRSYTCGATSCGGISMELSPFTTTTTSSTVTVTVTGTGSGTGGNSSYRDVGTNGMDSLAKNAGGIIMLVIVILLIAMFKKGVLK